MTHAVAHATIIANPRARLGATQELAGPVTEMLRAADVETHTILGVDADDARRQIERAVRTGTDALVVVGGDGSVRLAVEAIVGNRLAPPIGVVAAGSGNDVARCFGLPLDDPARAVDIVLGGITTPSDVGRVRFADDSVAHFVTVAATGFDASVTERALAMTWPHGQARYTLAMIRELMALSERRYEVGVHHPAGTAGAGSHGSTEYFHADLVFAAVANTTSYGGGMRIAPSASPTDGLLDTTMTTRPARWSRLTLLRVFPRVFRGTHMDHPMVRAARGDSIELASDPPAPVAVDGDLVGTLPATFEALPGAVRFFVADGDE